jgi:murein DD-endopeptidase MepM/ murein hydrolase activator NlpD
VHKDGLFSKNEARDAEEKRGYVDVVAAHAKGLVWPVKGEVIRKFGDDGSGVARTGINIAVPKGTPVLASEGGTVLYADDGLKIYGKMVLIRHDNGMVSAYAHNGYLLVKKNERVKKGQVLALSGATGNVESPQLHFELRQHASAIDPIAMLPRM